MHEVVRKVSNEIIFELWPELWHRQRAERRAFQAEETGETKA